jgi:two-component system chemotaxis response regulator CheY
MCVDSPLLDWHMAGEGGLKFLTECRLDARFRSLPIIIVTADSEHRNILLAQNNGATSYIVKPVSHDDLKKSVTQALKARLHEQSASAEKT